jgi:hypothetical protein
MALMPLNQAVLPLTTRQSTSMEKGVAESELGQVRAVDHGAAHGAVRALSVNMDRALNVEFMRVADR